MYLNIKSKKNTSSFFKEFRQTVKKVIEQCLSGLNTLTDASRFYLTHKLVRYYLQVSGQILLLLLLHCTIAETGTISSNISLFSCHIIENLTRMSDEL